MIRPSAARNLVLAEAMAALCFAGCQVGSTVSQSQSNSPNPSAIVVTISPGSGSIETGMSFQFTATVQGDSANKGVTWSIQSSAGCDCGTIDSTGKYIAPKTPHYAPGLIISATSVSDPTKSGTAVIFVTPAPNGVAVFPSSASVPLNSVQQFSAAGTPFSSNPVVTWSLSGNGCVATYCGTIDSTGKYTAPASSPVPPDVTITATSVADPSVAGFANVTIVAPANNPDNAKLNGHYAFLLRGYDGDGNAAFAGSFIADGTGNISNGIGDFVFSSGIQRVPNVAFTGNYSVTSDNRASITLASSTTWVTGLTFTMSLASFDQGMADRGQVVEIDNTDLWTTGLLAKQDPTAFSTAAVSGSYAFGFGGTAYSGFPLETAGRFSASGGSISAGHADVYGDGLSESGAGTVVPEPDMAFTGIYAVSSNGRGTAILNGLPYANFSFYVISSDELLFLELESCGAGICRDKSGISGTALRQSGAPYSTALLRGTSVFQTSSGYSTQGIVAVGEDSFDGTGNMSETRDQNQGGVITASTLNGTYTVDANGLGRGVMNLPGMAQPRSFYLVSPGKAFVIDLGGYEAGSFEPQVERVFGNASLAGSYAVGTLPWDFNWAFIPTSGVLTADGNGNLVGTTDSKGGTGVSITGSYSVASTGRATTTIVSANGLTTNWVFYLVSSSKAVGIDVTPGAVNSAARVLEK